MRARLASTPLPVYGLVMAVLFGGLMLLAAVTIQGERFSLALVAIYVVGGAIFGALMTVFMYIQRKRSGGLTLAIELQKSLKSEQLPENADPVLWGPGLENRRRQARLMRWLGPVEFGIFALLGVYLIVSEPSRSVFWVIYVLLFIAIGVWVSIGSQRSLRKVTALQAQLERKS